MGIEKLEDVLVRLGIKLHTIDEQLELVFPVFGIAFFSLASFRLLSGDPWSALWDAFFGLAVFAWVSRRKD